MSIEILDEIESVQGQIKDLESQDNTATPSAYAAYKAQLRELLQRKYNLMQQFKAGIQS